MVLPRPPPGFAHGTPRFCGKLSEAELVLEYSTDFGTVIELFESLTGGGLWPGPQGSGPGGPGEREYPPPKGGQKNQREYRAAERVSGKALDDWPLPALITPMPKRSTPLFGGAPKRVHA